MNEVQKILQSAPGEWLQAGVGAYVAVWVFKLIAGVVIAFLWLVVAAALCAAIASWAYSFWRKEDEVLTAEGEWEEGENKPDGEELK